MPGRPKTRARKEAAAALAAQPPKPAPSIADALRRLPIDWIAHHTARARIVVGLCLEEMHVRLADPAARAQIPLRDLAQAAQRTQATAALLAAEAWQRSGHPTIASTAPADAAEYLDAVSVDSALSTKRIDSVYSGDVAPARARKSGADPQPDAPTDAPTDAPGQHGTPLPVVVGEPADAAEVVSHCGAAKGRDGELT